MIQSIDGEGRGIRVAFERQNDRFGHHVFAVENAGHGLQRCRLLMTSNEQTDDGNWPLSPVLQSLSIEQRPTGAVALLVGMWGSSHWSLSAEARGETGEVVFDVACKAAAEAAWLGTVYANVAAMVSGCGDLPREPSASTVGRVNVSPRLESVVACGNSTCEIVPGEPLAGKTTNARSAGNKRSRRWSYSIVLETAAN